MNFEYNSVSASMARIINDGHKVMESFVLNPATVFVWIASCGRAKEVAYTCELKKGKPVPNRTWAAVLKKGSPLVAGCDSRSILTDWSKGELLLGVVHKRTV